MKKQRMHMKLNKYLKQMEDEKAIPVYKASLSKVRLFFFAWVSWNAFQNCQWHEADLIVYFCSTLQK